MSKSISEAVATSDSSSYSFHMEKEWRHKDKPKCVSEVPIPGMSLLFTGLVTLLFITRKLK